MISIHFRGELVTPGNKGSLPPDCQVAVDYLQKIPFPKNGSYKAAISANEDGSFVLDFKGPNSTGSGICVRKFVLGGDFATDFCFFQLRQIKEMESAFQARLAELAAIKAALPGQNPDVLSA